MRSASEVGRVTTTTTGAVTCVPPTVVTVAVAVNVSLWAASTEPDELVTTNPVTLDDTVLERGKQRYTIYCQPCHDARGDGKGILFQRGNVPTATFHQEKLLKYTDGQIFDVMTNGQGLMPAYRWPIPPADRWAIIAYIRGLQRERQARIASAPAGAQTAPAAQPATTDKPADKPAEKK